MFNAIIIDLDGTLVDSLDLSSFTINGDVNLREWIKSTKYSPVNEWCREIVNAFMLSGYHVVFLTARNDSKESKEITESWLNTNILPGWSLIMRPENDLRPDYAVKMDLYRNKIEPFYNVIFAIDDKPEVIEMWKSIGVTALSCADIK